MIPRNFHTYLIFVCLKVIYANNDHSPAIGFEISCSKTSDCIKYDTNLLCVERMDGKICRCRKTHIWDSGLAVCMRDDEDSYDPIQNLVIPAIIVMSVGAVVYLGIKLFWYCGKLWRRRRSPLAGGLETMAAPQHQPATWVFSQLSNPNRPPRHPTPCMGVFVPTQTFSQSPPPYEEALKHKVILSSYHPDATGPSIPLYAYTEHPPVEETSLPVIQVSGQGGRIVTLASGDQIRPLRYYPGEDNPQIPAVWHSIRTTELSDGQVQELVRSNPLATFRDSRASSRSTRSAVHRHSNDTPRCLQGESGT